ncbi:MAG: ComEC/Rec2 family competence protein [Leptospira sp.]|nr:ComEC/Rec2 family competence protein [Leptospira sp.]
MRHFFRKVFPVARLAYFFLGFLIFERIESVFRINCIPVILLLVAITLPALFGRFNKLLWFSGGVLISAIYIFSQSIISGQNPDRILGLRDWENLKEMSEKVKVTPQDEIRKGFHRSLIQIGDRNVFAMIRFYETAEAIPVLECSPGSLNFRRVENSRGDYFKFLEKYENFYLIPDLNRCKVVSMIPDKRKNFKKQLEELLVRGGLTDYSHDISLGLIFGDSSYLDREFKKKAREGGILHLFAASGLHIGVLIGFVYFLISKLPFSNYYLLRLIPLLVAFCYLHLLNYPVSLSRAYLFSTFFVVASMFFRKTHSTDILLYSAALICIFDFDNYLTLSFNLSYSAVCGIFYLKNPLDDILFGKFKNFLTDNLTISLAASLGTFPVLFWYFHSFSFGSILINLVLVPMTSFILPLLYTSLTLEFLQIPFLKDISWAYSDLLLRLQAYLSDFLSEKISFFREFENFSMTHLILYILIMVLLICLIFAKEWFQKRINKDLLVEWKKRTLSLSLPEKKKLTTLNISVSVILLSGILIFLFAGYNVPSKQAKTDWKSASFDYYLVQSGSRLYLGGSCKYNFQKIKSILQNQICGRKINTVNLESESCLSLAFLCKSSIKKLNYSEDKIGLWKERYPEITFEKIRGIRNAVEGDGSFIVFFRPAQDSLESLIRFTKEGKGRIVLFFPYKSKDNPEDWTKNQKLLGINQDWRFITPDEL